MDILITGAAGQLGTELQTQLNNGKCALGRLPERLHGAGVTAVDIQDADLSKLGEVRELIHETKPSVVINCAAFTNVDGCETEPDAAFAANAIAPRNLAMACEEAGARLVHVSTDYVFAGTGSRPYVESDPTGPQTVYGASKLMGENYVRTFSSKWFIVRTAWLYGLQGGNFVKTIMRLARDKGALSVVNDQQGNPTNAEDLAYHLLKIAASEEYGLYHCTGKGVCSWYDFAVEIVRLAGIGAKTAPVDTEASARPAKRPAYSALDHTMLRLTVGDDMRPWRNALADYIAKLEGKTL